MHPQYPNLFSPLKVKNVTFKNRMFAAPMGARGNTPEGLLTEEGITMYEAFARSGVGCVIMGESLVHSATGNNHGHTMRMDDPATIPQLRRCVDRIHSYQAVCSIEILHPGRRADPLYNKDGKTYGPSAGSCHYGDGAHEVTELTEEMIDTIVNAFGDAAEMAKVAGCDMVTVHGGHGWLLGQFLAPNNNWRTDRFGGSIENRCRIHVMVADNIRKKCGDDFLIDFRMSGDDFTEDGATLTDMVEVCKILAPHVDMLHISATSFHNRRASIRMFPSMFYDHGCNVFLAEEIRKHVNVPVITVGGLSDPAQMEEIIASGKADGVAMARQLLADPMTGEKALWGKSDDIVPCIRCNECLSMNFVPYVKYPLAIAHCAVNPWVSRFEERKYSPKPVGNLKVLIAGAGPAGMQAALGAAECGHTVILAEKTDSFGGMLKKAWNPDFKQDIKKYVEVLSRRILKDERITVMFNTTVDRALIEELAPDAVIAAIGAEPVVPPIPGADKDIAVLGTELHDGKPIGEKVVFIGGGLVGCEEGLYLAKYLHKNVTVLEMTDKLMKGAPFIHYISTLNEMELQQKEGRMDWKNCCTVKEITDSGVIVTDEEGKTYAIEADTVVLSTGLRSKTAEAESLMGHTVKSMMVGDCRKPARMNEAVSDGYFAGYNLQRMF